MLKNFFSPNDFCKAQLMVFMQVLALILYFEFRMRRFARRPESLFKVSAGYAPADADGFLRNPTNLRAWPGKN